MLIGEAIAVFNQDPALGRKGHNSAFSFVVEKLYPIATLEFHSAKLREKRGEGLSVRDEVFYQGIHSYKFCRRGDFYGRP
jgi:hypothetical protein